MSLVESPVAPAKMIQQSPPLLKQLKAESF